MHIILIILISFALGYFQGYHKKKIRCEGDEQGRIVQCSNDFSDNVS